MGRPGPSLASREEYARLRLFTEVAWEWLISHRAFGDLENPITQMPEELTSFRGCTPSQVLGGLREAASDTIEMTRDFPVADLEVLETKLAENGAPSLAVLRSKYWKKLLAILRRGKINDEAEYRLVNERASSLDDGLLSESQRELANKLMSQFEVGDPDDEPA